WIDKTQHKPLLPSSRNIGNGGMKLKYPSLILVLLLVVPTFLAQSKTDFIYGIGEQPESTRAGSDIVKIEKEFGKNTAMVLLVPKGDVAKEEDLVRDLEDLEQVNSILAYVNTVSSAIPPEYLDESVSKQFYSDNYSRIILQTNTETEGDAA